MLPRPRALILLLAFSPLVSCQHVRSKLQADDHKPKSPLLDFIVAAGPTTDRQFYQNGESSEYLELSYGDIDKAIKAFDALKPFFDAADGGPTSQLLTNPKFITALDTAINLIQFAPDLAKSMPDVRADPDRAAAAAAVQELAGGNASDSQGETVQSSMTAYVNKSQFVYTTGSRYLTHEAYGLARELFKTASGNNATSAYLDQSYRPEAADAGFAKQVLNIADLVSLSAQNWNFSNSDYARIMLKIQGLKLKQLVLASQHTSAAGPTEALYRRIAENARRIGWEIDKLIADRPALLTLQVVKRSANAPAQFESYLLSVDGGNNPQSYRVASVQGTLPITPDGTQTPADVAWQLPLDKHASSSTGRASFFWWLKRSVAKSPQPAVDAATVGAALQKFMDYINVFDAGSGKYAVLKAYLVDVNTAFGSGSLAGEISQFSVAPPESLPPPPDAVDASSSDAKNADSPDQSSTESRGEGGDAGSGADAGRASHSGGR